MSNVTATPCFYSLGFDGYTSRTCPCEYHTSAVANNCHLALGDEGYWSCEDCSCESCRNATSNYPDDEIWWEKIEAMWLNEEKEVAMLLEEWHHDAANEMWWAVGDRMAGYRTIGFSI